MTGVFVTPSRVLSPHLKVKNNAESKNDCNLGGGQYFELFY
jgi:hypothetical protein